MKIPKGFVFLWRCIDDQPIMKASPCTRETFLYLLRQAQFKETTIPGGKVLKRGQIFTTYKQIINALSWNIGTRTEGYQIHHIETAMKTMKKTGLITTQKTTRGIIVTICEYDLYQSKNSYENHNENHNETR